MECYYNVGKKYKNIVHVPNLFIDYYETSDGYLKEIGCNKQGIYIYSLSKLSPLYQIKDLPSKFLQLSINDKPLNNKGVVHINNTKTINIDYFCNDLQYGDKIKITWYDVEKKKENVSEIMQEMNGA